MGLRPARSLTWKDTRGGSKVEARPSSRHWWQRVFFGSEGHVAQMAILLFFSEFLLCVVCIKSPEPVWFQDSVLYEAVGANLAAGHGYSADFGPPYRPEITRTPFVPAMVAAVYSVTGRNPRAIIWLNALLVSASVSLGYLTMRRLSGDEDAARAGGMIALLCPFIPGAAVTINTEAPAMLQVIGAAFLLTKWVDGGVEVSTRRSLALGLLLASLVLNRVNLLPAVTVAAGYWVWRSLRGRLASLSAWSAALAFSASLIAPTILWSARNASIGLKFSPAPIGVYASRVHDAMRYREVIFAGAPPPPPAPNVRFFQNWKWRYGPEELMQLEGENEAWFREVSREKGDRLLAAMPTRLAGLFSSSTVSTYPVRDPEGIGFPASLLRWVSRGLWVLSLLGLVSLWEESRARWVWLVPVLTLVPIHLLTVCTSRYMTGLMPFLLPYGGAAIVWAARKVPFRRFAWVGSGGAGAN